MSAPISPAVPAPGATPPGPANDAAPAAAPGTEGPGGDFSISAPGGVVQDLERGLVIARGAVTFGYRELTVHADRGVVDLNKNQATLSGNLTVTVRGRVFKGKTLTFNLDTGHWLLSQIERVFPPEEFADFTVLSPIYLKGGVVSGTLDTVGGSDFRFTTCDRDHYYVKSQQIDFYRDARGNPGRIVLRRNFLYVLGHKIAPLPVYVISLTGERSRRTGLQPTFGYNDFDGYFARTLYDLDATSGHTDSLLVDLLQKRGLGLGLQRELARGAGLLYLYALSGKTGGREIDSRLSRQFRISPSVLSIVNFQSTQNSTFGAGVATYNGDLSFGLHTHRIQSDLLLRTSSNTSQFSIFRDLGVTLQHQQDLGGGLQLNTSSIYASSQSTGVSRTATLDNIVNLTQRLHTFDALLRTELHNELTGGTGTSGTYQLQRLPELNLETDTDRLKLPLLGRLVPGSLLLGLGNYDEPASQQRLTRTDFIYTARPRSEQLLHYGSLRSVLNATGLFEQAFYSDDAARYNYNYAFGLDTGFLRPRRGTAGSPFGPGLQQAITPGNPLFNSTVNTGLPLSFGPSSSNLGPLVLHLDYLKQRQVGFTPFQFDFAAPGESVAGTLSFTPTEKFSFNLSSGRDLQNKFSNDVIATVQMAPSRAIYTSLGVSYSPQTKTYGDIVANLRLDRNQRHLLGGIVDLGVRYSPQTSQVTQANLVADVSVFRKTRVQALTSYNGFSRQLEFSQLRVTQDLHCFNLYTTYDSQRHELRFDLALKAFPFVDTRLGMGQFGQGFDAGISQPR